MLQIYLIAFRIKMLNYSVRSNNFSECFHIDVVLLELKMLYFLTQISGSLIVQIRYTLYI